MGKRQFHSLSSIVGEKLTAKCKICGVTKIQKRGRYADGSQRYACINAVERARSLQRKRKRDDWPDYVMRNRRQRRMAYLTVHCMVEHITTADLKKAGVPENEWTEVLRWITRIKSNLKSNAKQLAEG